MKKGIRSSAYMRTISTIYLAQMMTLILFSMVVFYLNNSSEREVNGDLSETLQYPLSIVFIICLAASQLVPNYLIKKIDTAEELKHKLPRYVTAVIIRAACLEMPGIFACVVAFLTSESYYLLVIPLLLIIFAMYRPSRSSIVSELKLNATERDQLNDPDAIVAEINNP